MDPAVIATLVVSICVAIGASITAPLILARQAEKMRRQDREADWDRQDEVARRAANATATVAASQKRIADQAAKAAEALLEANAKVAATADETNGKLDVIHALVNSQMTAAMQSEYDATVRELAMMQEVIGLRRAAGHEPSQEALLAAEATQAKIAELAARLEDRAKAQERANEKRPSGDGT